MNILTVDGSNHFEAYRRGFHELYSVPSASPSDPELLRECVGHFSISPSSWNPPFCVANNEFCGSFDYQRYVHCGETLFPVVRSHYERILLKSGALERVVETLRKKPLSKRAIADVWNYSTTGRRDTPCLVYLWFRIDRDQVLCHVHMRANDAYKKLLMNFHLLCAAHRWVADSLNLEAGEYTHFCDSLHFYKIDRVEIDRLYSSIDSLSENNFAHQSTDHDQLRA